MSAYIYCIEGHLCVPCVQKTQQSPFFGLISSPHFSQLYFIIQTSVGIVSIFLCPHFGHVISDCITILLSAFVESFEQQESFGFLLSVVMVSFFFGVEQLVSTIVPIIIEKCLIVCILFCLTELSRPIEPNVLQIDVGGLSKLPVSIPTKGYLKINVY